jgi:HD superfamily phosphohydrolase
MYERLIQDAVWGAIPADRLMADFMDTPEVQRLRHIKQLGLANLVFPSAVHTRFEHSLGVTYLVRRMSDLLGLRKDELELLTVSAVLHDVGHGPFSHVTENLFEKYFGENHMELAGDLLAGKKPWYPEGTMEPKGVKTVMDVIGKYGFCAKEIAGMIVGEHKSPYLGELLHGGIDADSIEYLLRDSFFSGVAAGTIDVDRLMSVLTIHEGRLLVTHKGIDAMEGFVTARALMFSVLYYHKTVRIVELMLANAADLAIMQGSAIGKDNFHRLTDTELIARLLDVQGAPSDIMNRILCRQLFKRVYYEERRELAPLEKRKFIRRYGTFEQRQKIQDEIAELAKAPRGYVVLDAPYSDVLLTEPRIGKTDINILTANGEVIDLSEISPIVVPLQKRQTPKHLLQVAAPPEYASSVGKAAREILAA